MFTVLDKNLWCCYTYTHTLWQFWSPIVRFFRPLLLGCLEGLSKTSSYSFCFVKNWFIVHRFFYSKFLTLRSCLEFIIFSPRFRNVLCSKFISFCITIIMNLFWFFKKIKRSSKYLFLVLKSSGWIGFYKSF